MPILIANCLSESAQSPFLPKASPTKNRVIFIYCIIFNKMINIPLSGLYPRLCFE